MVNAIPKWVWKRYALMWQHFKEEDFSYKELAELLKHDDKNSISVTINELKRAGWLEVMLNQEDTRKRDYKLINPTLLVEAISKNDN